MLNTLQTLLGAVGQYPVPTPLDQSSANVIEQLCECAMVIKDTGM